MIQKDNDQEMFQKQYERQLQQFMPSKQKLKKQQVKIDNAHNMTQNTQQKQTHNYRRSINSHPKNSHPSQAIQPTVSQINPLLIQLSQNIQLLNIQISSQIANEQQKQLNEYQNQLKSKQSQLNRLKHITNKQMIQEKTVQKKLFLKGVKEELIRGNFYYDHRMNILKSQLQQLINKRDIMIQQLGKYHQLSIHNQPSINHQQAANYQSSTNHQSSANYSANYQNLIHNQSSSSNKPSSSITHNQLNSNQSINYTDKMFKKNRFNRLSKQNSAKKLSYFNDDNHIEQILKKYNQYSGIYQDIQSSNIQNIQNKKTNKIQNSRFINGTSVLPRIDQKNLTKSINPQSSIQDYLSYRPIKRKYDRTTSIESFNINKSIDQSLMNIPLKTYKKKQIAILFGSLNRQDKYLHKSNNITQMQKKKHSQSMHSRLKGLTQANTLSLVLQTYNKINKSISETVNTTAQKQHFQQFIVKKKEAQHKINKNIKKTPNISAYIKLIQTKQQIYMQKFEPILQIQKLFKQSMGKYYQLKRQGAFKAPKVQKKVNNKITQKTQFNQISQQNQQDQQISQDRQSTTTLDIILRNKKVNKPQVQINNSLKKQQTVQPAQIKQPQPISNQQNLLQLNDFDKKGLMDLLFQSIKFKRHIYSLIQEEFKNPKIQGTNIKDLIRVQLNMLKDKHA